MAARKSPPHDLVLVVDEKGGKHKEEGLFCRRKRAGIVNITVKNRVIQSLKLELDDTGDFLSLVYIFEAIFLFWLERICR